MADYSAFFRISFSALDGSTDVNFFAWGADTPDVYRRTDVVNVGIFPVNAFTRSPAEPNSSTAPIAPEGALIVARLPGASATAQIGVIPNGSSEKTQLQWLRADPVAKLWTFPGDKIYVRDPTLARGNLDMFVRPLNIREVDQLINFLPTAASVSATSIQTLDVAGAVPFTAGFFRTIYLVSPPAADTVYTLPASALVTPGHELVFVGMNGRSFVLSAPEINGSTSFGDFYAPSYSTVSMIGYGGGFAAHGAAQDRSVTLGSGDPIGVFRGTKKIVINVAAAEVFPLPSAITIPNDAELLVHNKGAGTVTLQAAVTQFINSATTLVLATGKAAQLTPSGPNWIGVKT